MWEQAKALQEGAEIVVCTPVREEMTNFCLPFNKKIPPQLLQQMRYGLFMCACIGSSD